jgi:formylglycine-generating enzyme required for sulfatase activity
MMHFKITFFFVRLLLVPFVVLTSLIVSTLGQEVSIPDPGLNAAVREALQKPAGPLTQQDLLSLTILSAGGRQISSVQGLEAARNLRILDLDANSLTNFPIASALTNLTILDLFNNHLTSFVLSNAPPKLAIIDVAFNSLTQCSLPAGLTNLDTLFLEGNGLTNFLLPSGLTGLTQLDLSGNALTRFTVRPEMTNLVTLLLFANQLTNLTLPANLKRLGALDLDFNNLQSLELPAGLTNLISFVARDNQLTNLTLRSDMANLSFVDLGQNRLAQLTLPAGLNRLNFLRLPDNKLTSVTLPPSLTNLASLFLQDNQLTNLSLSFDLNQLVQLDLRDNQLTSLTLPTGLTHLITLGVDGNPLTTLVLPEPLAATDLAVTVATLRNQGVNVFTYPLSVQLTRIRQPIGAFQFALVGPPGDYTILSSTNLASWSAFREVSNPLGSVVITDGGGNLSAQKFYRALRQNPPPNMVFIPPNTFTMGSPANEQDRQANEGPQTTVTLSRGFWIGTYEVTQGEYLAVTGTNPSQFPGDLNRPVSSVSWPAATNYCGMLTQLERAAGRISADSQYRLPTEAEWECAARAGTSTRFSYGDDPDYSSLPNYAWQSLSDGLTVHSVGQKLPNPWGLYDMAGNVLEWCQDWFGPLPGGSVTDPQGPPSNPIGEKIMRGGAFDFGGNACRSASRMIFGNHPALTDWNLGFRVVLVTGPQ